MREHPTQASEICLEQFPQESKTDTVTLIKDSIYIDAHIDTFYNWLVEEHYIDSVVVKEKLRTLIKTVKDTVIVTTVKWDDRYKILYEQKDKEYAILDDRHARKSKALFWTWLWIGLVGAGYIAYKRYI